MFKLKDARWYIGLDDDSREKAVKQLDAIMPINVTYTDKISGSLTIVVGSPETCSEIKKACGNGIINLSGCGIDDHIVKSAEMNGKKCIIIVGTNPKAAIYGIFSFLERLGFYFLASGTIIPEMAADIHIPEINEIIPEFRKQLSELKGKEIEIYLIRVKPVHMHNFPEAINLSKNQIMLDFSKGEDLTWYKIVEDLISKIKEK